MCLVALFYVGIILMAVATTIPSWKKTSSTTASQKCSDNFVSMKDPSGYYCLGPEGQATLYTGAAFSLFVVVIFSGLYARQVQLL